MRRIVMLSLLACLFGPVPESRAQTWVRGYFGAASESFADVEVTLDQSTVFAGYTTSFGAGGRDVWVVKVGDCGFVEWQRTFGGEGDEQAEAIVGTDDGGFLVVATTTSFGSGGSDIWALKLDADGNLEKDAAYGSEADETAADVIQVAGGYVVVGNVAVQTGIHDATALKLELNLDLDWAKVYGGNGNDEASSLEPAVLSAGFVIAGFTDSFGQGDGDFWVLQLSSTGDVVRERTYHGLGTDFARDIHSIFSTETTGYLVAGETTDPTDGKEMWLVHIDSDLAVEWGRVFGGPGEQVAHGVQTSLTTPGFVLVGENDGTGAGGVDAWLLQLDTVGSIKAQKTYGDTGDEAAFAVQENIFTGEYIVAGAQETDAWALRLAAGMSIDGTCSLDADTNVPDTALSPTVGFPQSFSLVSVPGVVSAMVSPVVSSASVHLACTGRPSEVSGPDPFRGSTRFIEPLIFTGEDEATWEPAINNCANFFNIYSGDLFSLAGLEFGSCELTQLQDNTVQLSKVPAEREGYFYLVSGVNDSGEGTLGFTTVGFERFPELVCP